MRPETDQSTEVSHRSPASRSADSYVRNGGHWSSWLLTNDHKRIAVLYLVCVTILFLIGTLFASLMRVELVSPTSLLVSENIFNRLFTMHGVFMIFFVLIPAIPAVLGNFLLPLKIGSRNFAFPRLNLASFYLLLAGGILLILAALRGGFDSTWTFYTATGASETFVLAVIAVILASTSILLSGINSVVTVHKMRAKGLFWSRLPAFVWTHYAAAVIMVLATPILILVMLVLVAERILGVGIFDPAVGGDPLLLRRLFWSWARPGLYIMILPAIGVVTEVLSAYAGRSTVGSRAFVGSVFAIVFLGFFSGGGHLLVSSQSVFSGLVSSLAAYLSAIPFALILLGWLKLLFHASISLKSPFLYAVASIALTLIGGLTGLVLSSAGTNVHLHGTLFVVAHFHYLLAGSVIMAYLAGLHFWWPKITGVVYTEGIAMISAAVLFIGLNLTFFPQLLLGSLGVPRRHFSYPADLEALQILSTAGFSILLVGYVLPMIYLLWSLERGATAEENPPHASGLEWRIPSPPPADNFLEPPVVGEKAG